MTKKHVYLAQQVGTNLYKIGFTSNIKRRIYSLQSGNPNKLQIVQSWETHKAEVLEKWFHQKCRNYRKCREWFQFNDLAMIKLLDIQLRSPDLKNKFGAYELTEDDCKEVIFGNIYRLGFCDRSI